MVHLPRWRALRRESVSPRLLDRVPHRLTFCLVRSGIRSSHKFAGVRGEVCICSRAVCRRVGRRVCAQGAVVWGRRPGFFRFSWTRIPSICSIISFILAKKDKLDFVRVVSHGSGRPACALTIFRLVFSRGRNAQRFEYPTFDGYVAFSLPGILSQRSVASQATSARKLVLPDWGVPRSCRAQPLEADTALASKHRQQSSRAGCSGRQEVRARVMGAEGRALRQIPRKAVARARAAAAMYAGRVECAWITLDSAA